MHKIQSIKRSVLINVLILCVGPAIILIASGFGAGVLDGLGGSTSEFAGLLMFGLFCSFLLPLLVIMYGIYQAASYHKQTAVWAVLPLAYLLLSVFALWATIGIGVKLSTFVDCEIAKEQNQVKCGF